MRTNHFNTLLISNLSRIMRERELSQRALSRITGFKPNTISRWISGESRPLFCDIAFLAQCLGVEVGDFLRDN